jgi:hypothetical protein
MEVEISKRLTVGFGPDQYFPRFCEAAQTGGDIQRGAGDAVGAFVKVHISGDYQTGIDAAVHRQDSTDVLFVLEAVSVHTLMDFSRGDDRPDRIVFVIGDSLSPVKECLKAKPRKRGAF